jgi:DNA-binding transcriptional MerR regulator
MKESTLLSIKEFSEFTGVNQSTLRYYDEIGILSASRGENNHRYYAPIQIIKLNYINVLVDLGVPLSVIRGMNESRTPESVIELLNQQEIKLDYKLAELRTAYSIIHTYRKNIQEGMMAQDGVIRIENMDETRYILGRLNDVNFKTDETFYEGFIRFCRSAPKRQINLRYPVGAYHDNINTFIEMPGRPERFFSLDPLGNSMLSAGKYLVGYCLGYYGEFGDTAKKICQYAQEQNLVFRGPVYVIYLLDEISRTESNQFLSKIFVSVSERNKIKSINVNNKITSKSLSKTKYPNVNRD